MRDRFLGDFLGGTAFGLMAFGLFRALVGMAVAAAGPVDPFVLSAMRACSPFMVLAFALLGAKFAREGKE